MSRREREAAVSLDGLSTGQLAILREDAGDLLLARAEDLRLLHRDEEPRRAVREVAALARLCSGLRHGEVFVPDRTLTELVARWTAETGQLEEVKEVYERALAEHEAWVALLACFTRHRRAGSAEPGS